MTDSSQNTVGRLVGIDTGGTFTDIMYRIGGELVVQKLLSTPDDPSLAIGRGYRDAVQHAGESAGGGGEASPPVVHGTTVATNALLERSLAPSSLLVTAGFEDLLALRRQNRKHLYDLHVDERAPLLDRDRVIGVSERMDPDGAVVEPLGSDDIRRVLDRLVELEAQGELESVAICLLHAYANPIHESKLDEAIRGDDRLDAAVSTSHRVAGEFREYERASTTVVNAALAPVMDDYLGRLSERLPAVNVEILQSSGGRVDVEHARRFPVQTVLSGPAGGAVGAFAQAERLGEDKILSLDMGGTSTDVSFCDGELSLSASATIDEIPIQTPVVDIHTVGAGGGSIARKDAGGGLRVGPESAGADPGPACYGRGGSAPTVTDAHVVLGRIQPGRFLGGEMNLDVEAAAAAIGELGDEIGMGVEETALGVLRVAEASMTRALKVMSVQRGEDPRELALVAFGGAGALHACRLAEQLDIPTVVVPRNMGLLSAYGMLHADYQRITQRSVLRGLDRAIDESERLIDDLFEMIRGIVASAPHPAAAFEYELEAAMRYEGQSYDIRVPVDWADAVVEQLGGDTIVGEVEGAAVADSIVLEHPADRFEERHEELYGYRADRMVELVGLRLRAVIPGAEPVSYRQSAVQSSNGSPTEESEATVRFCDGGCRARVVDRRALTDGEQLEGPTIVTEYSGTTVLPPDWRGRVESGALVLEPR